METGKQELQEKFKNQMVIRVDILRDVSINYNYAKYLFTNYSLTKINSHWGHIKYNFFKLLIIDLAKLFVDNQNQKLNFFKFLIQLENEDYKNLGVLQNRIDHYRNELNAYNQFYTSIKYYRDKLFAHTEILVGISPQESFFTQLENLINLGFEISNEFSKTIVNNEIINIINLIDLSDFKIV